MIDFDKVVGWIQDHLEETLAWIARLESGLNDGIGWYFVCSALLGLAAFFTHRALVPLSHATAGLDRVLTSEQEPMRPVKRQALWTALVADSTWSVCDSDLATSSAGALDEAFSIFERHFDAAGRTKLEDVPTIASILMAAGPSASGARARLLTATKIEAHAIKPELLASNYPMAGGVHAETDGSALNDFSTLRIPGQLTVGGRESEQFRRISDVAARSAAGLYPLEGLIGRPAVMESSAAAKDDYPTFAQFYFISLDGALRIMPRMTGDLDAQRLFHAAAYVEESLAQNPRPRLRGGEKEAGSSELCPSHIPGVTRYHSRPYIDLTGNGIVSTICYRVPHDGVPKGVFCADVLLPPNEIHAMIDRADLLDIVLARAKTKNKKLSDIQFCGDAGLSCKNPVMRQSTKRTYRDLVYNWWDIVRSSSPVAGAAEVPLQSNPGMFAAVVSRHADEKSGEDVYEIALLKVRDRFSGIALDVLAAVVLIGLVAILLSSGRERQENRRRGDLIRSLQVGVIEVDDRERIIGANERCEQILNRSLPRLSWSFPQGLDPTQWLDREIVFTDLIYKKIVIFPNESGGFDRGDFERVQSAREVGRTTSYWAKLEIAGGPGEQPTWRWCHITGSPVIQPGSNVLYKFGTIEPADETTAKELEKLIKVKV